MSIWNQSRCEMISVCLNCRETFPQTGCIKLRAGLDVGVAIGEEKNLIFSYNVSNSFCKLLSLIPFTFKELNKASSCTYTKCNLWWETWTASCNKTKDLGEEGNDMNHEELLWRGWSLKPQVPPLLHYSSPIVCNHCSLQTIGLPWKRTRSSYESDLSQGV
jgi:hypothetical protein